MAQRTRSEFAGDITSKTDTTGSRGTSGQDVIDLLNNLKDSALWYDEGLAAVLEDTTPQLGGNLDINGSKIVSTSNGDIDIEPHGTGNVILGNFVFNADQTVGAGQDNYVMKYDHSTLTIGLEVEAGGSGGYSQEEIEDFVAGMFSGGSIQTRIAITYDDENGELDLAVNDDLSLYDNTTSGFITAASAPVASVAGKTGTVLLAAGDIASGAFADARISETSVTQHEAALSVASSQVSGTFGAGQIADEAITLPKLQHIATARLLGRTTSGTGDVETLVTADILKTKPEHITIAVSDEATDLTTGTAKVTFRMPYAFTLTAVRASVNTAPVGSTVIVDINEAGTTILSTKLSIDASEKTTTTAATPAVISDAALADDAEITIDIDQIGSSTPGKGLKVTLIGTQT